MYNFFIRFVRRKNKIIPDEDSKTYSTSNSVSLFDYEKTKKLDLTDKKYYSLIQNIRNLLTLTPEEMEYVDTLPRDNLIDLIKLYNEDIAVTQRILNN